MVQIEYSLLEETKEINKKLLHLKSKNECLFSEIENGKIKFSDNEKVIGFRKQVTEYFIVNKMNLSEFDMKVMERMTTEGVNSFCFCMVSDIKGDKEENRYIEIMSRNNFRKLGNLAYVSLD